MLTLNLQRLSKSIPTKKPAYLSSLQYHQSHPTQVSTALGSPDEGLEEAANKTLGTLPSTAHQAPRHQQEFVPANQSDKAKKNKSRR
jgi:hypothetical protein